MKSYVLAIAALGLAGTIGTANAAPDTSNTVNFWNAATNLNEPADSISADASQQALPSAITAITGVSGNFTLGSTSYSAAINYNLPANGTDTILGFFNADSPSIGAPSTCDSTCQALTLSTTKYNNVTLFEFTFTTGEEMFSVTHDDGVSLFKDGDTTTDLLPMGDSAPTTQVTSVIMDLPAGTYDLYYTAANGLPEVLETNSVPVPAPPIGRGLPVLLAVGGLLFGAKLWERSKRRSPLETVVSHAAA